MPTYIGTSKNEILTGSASNDTLDGGLGNDTLTGGAGADFFKVTSGTDTITDLGNGVDILSVSFGATAVATISQAWTATANTKNSGNVVINTAGMAVDLSSVTAGGGKYTITNTSSNGVNLRGSVDADFLTGGSGVDTLDGGSGSNTLTGGAGADYFKITPGHQDEITDLGNGADQLTVALNGSVVATLAQTWTATASTKNSGNVIINTSGMNVNLSSASAGGGIYSIADSSSNGTNLIGSVDSDFFFGNDGDDTLTGGAGADFFKVTSGTDTITDLGNGVDILSVDSGATAVATISQAWTATANTKNSGIVKINTAGMSIDLSLAKSGGGQYEIKNTSSTNTSLTGSVDKDILIGGSGIDTIYGGLGNDTLTGGTGADLFKVTSGTDTITDLGNGVDILSVDSGATAVATISQAWTATANTKNSGNVLISTAGVNVNLLSATAGGGKYTIKNTSSTGAVLNGASDSCFIDGGNGNDSISGGSNNDSISGGGGNDSIFGGAGLDTIFGGDGNDTMDGSKGWDTLTGGAGNDVFVLSDIGGDTFADFTPGVDKIRLNKNFFTSIKPVGDKISSVEFGSGANFVSSQTKEMHLMYDITTGILRYDSDGSVNGVLNAVQIAIIGEKSHPALSYSDFIVA